MKKTLTIISIALIALSSVFIPGAKTNLTQAQTPATTQNPSSVEVPILVYHSVRPYYPSITKIVKEFTVPPDVFEKQVQYLKDNGYTAITMDDLADFFNKNKPLPPKPVVITFDDGWKNQYRYAFPILQKYNEKATFYIYSNAIGRKHFFSWDEVKALDAAGMTIGDHTKSHPELNKITSPVVLQTEIVDSKHLIESHLGKTIDTFAYPFGEYTDQDIALLKSSGYTTARALKSGINQTSADLFTLRGIIVTGNFNRFVSMLKTKQPETQPAQIQSIDPSLTLASNTQPDALSQDSGPKVLIVQSYPNDPISTPAPVSNVVLAPTQTTSTSTTTTTKTSTTTPTVVTTPISSPALAISSISATNLSTSAATIIWQTNIPATSSVIYGITTSYGSTSPTNTQLTLSHTVTLSGLKTKTLYHYKVQSKDAKGNLVSSTDQTFTTK